MTPHQIGLIQSAYTTVFGAWADTPRKLVEALEALAAIAKPEVRDVTVWLLVKIATSRKINGRTLLYLAEQAAARLERKLAQAALKASVNAVTGKKQ